MSREQHVEHFVGPGAQRYYAESADRLGRQYESVAFEDAHEAFLPFLPPGPATAADIGAGTGRDAAALAARGYAITAVEPVRELRDLARRLHPGPSITWLADSLPALTRLEGPFDLILVSAVWMHLEETERPRAMARLHDLLAPAGRLLVSLRHGPPPPDRRMFDVSDEETVELARRHGLRLLNHTAGTEDRLGRPEVRWISLVFAR
ncbi:class I SAM-dependent methyltransferase [Streptomyces litchfieldiae]|uniref:Class I SAM-dependent methyltransferase n=1 Tax=Streptomyces litchfieldiae TaxID=3075543 RepID=A0ABU2MP39_9ACTN|nr:class I SAM-dependent methyltransferase [Streptomyces sp. DSM 44938]MDT0342839.1 class I SAM-dependent methyltransferase [Streptomyces sp. DSM 44938]